MQIIDHDHARKVAGKQAKKYPFVLVDGIGNVHYLQKQEDLAAVNAQKVAEGATVYFVKGSLPAPAPQPAKPVTTDGTK
jgi:hypothetical protein